MKIARRTSKADVPTVAMGDIAFNLLIFFVILARAQDDSHLQWQPAAVDRVEGAGASKVSVVIDTENHTYVNGQRVGLAELSARISDVLGDAPFEDRIVLLKVHREVPAQFFEPVIESISESGGKLIHILEENQ